MFCSFATDNLSFWKYLGEILNSTPMTLPRHDSGRALERKKVYLAFETNEGDTPRILTSQFTSAWLSPNRGTVPISWAVDPLLGTFFPEVSFYFFTARFSTVTAISTDELYMVPIQNDRFCKVRFTDCVRYPAAMELLCLECHNQRYVRCRNRRCRLCLPRFPRSAHASVCAAGGECNGGTGRGHHRRWCCHGKMACHAPCRRGDICAACEKQLWYGGDEFCLKETLHCRHCQKFPLM